MREVTLFAGPSAYGLDRAQIEADAVSILPPVRRGEVDRLVANAHPSVIVICDGVFGSAAAVSHAELCDALDAGWDIWGVSSMGAIRAYELRSEGMHGFGYVHSKFYSDADFNDDEMCLLHFPEPPYFPLSEALVNLRFALEHQGAALGIAASSQHKVVSALRELWFGDRTEERMRSIMVGRAGIGATEADALLAWLRSHRVKSMDLADLMARRPWAQGTSPARP
jgi:hypothetical protein